MKNVEIKLEGNQAIIKIDPIVPGISLGINCFKKIGG